MLIFSSPAFLCDMAVANTRLHDACAKLDLADRSYTVTVIDVLDEQSKALAVNERLRSDFFPWSLHAHTDNRRADMGEAGPDIWRDIRRLWTMVSTAHSGLTSEVEDDERGATLRALTVSLARFTRNLVAAVPHNQQQALSAVVHPYVPGPFC